MLIQVLCKQVSASEELLQYDIEPAHKDFYWAETAIRAEDIHSFYKMTPTKTVVKFYDTDLRPLVIKEKFEDFMNRVQDMEYNIPSNDGNETE